MRPGPSRTARSESKGRCQITPNSEKWRARYGPWGVVTGASRGIGYAFASRLAAAGLHLVLVGRNHSLLAKAADELSSRHGVNTLVVRADLAEPDGPALVRERTVDVDVGLVVLSAGDGCEGEFSEHALDDERRVVRLNVLATLDLSHVFAGRLQKRGCGGLIIVSSLLAYQGSPYAANYAATKAYGLVLGESLHFELQPHGVDVLALAPGPTMTGAAQRVDRRRFLNSQWCTPTHVVDTALGALGRRASAVPGAVNNLMLWAGGLPAREARSHMIGRIAKELTGNPGT
jgi:uncharacterized protein